MPQWSLFERDFRAIDAVLGELLERTNALSVHLVDRSGQLISSAGRTGDFDVTAFASLVAADFTANIPGVGILWGAPPGALTTQAFDDLKAMGVVGFDLDYGLVTQEFIDAAHDNGLFVVVYTVFDPDTMLQMIELGVDGMETDFPVVLDSLMPAPLN